MVSGVRRMPARKRSSTPVSRVTLGMISWICRSFAGNSALFKSEVSVISAYSMP